jgi:hypothetical protein
MYELFLLFQGEMSPLLRRSGYAKAKEATEGFLLTK